MYKLTGSLLAIISGFSCCYALAVDESSSAYQTGNLVGKIFIALLVMVIIRRIFFKK